MKRIKVGHQHIDPDAPEREHILVVRRGASAPVEYREVDGFIEVEDEHALDLLAQIPGAELVAAIAGSPSSSRGGEVSASA